MASSAEVGHVLRRRVPVGSVQGCAGSGRYYLQNAAELVKEGSAREVPGRRLQAGGFLASPQTPIPPGEVALITSIYRGLWLFLKLLCTLLVFAPRQNLVARQKSSCLPGRPGTLGHPGQARSPRPLELIIFPCSFNVNLSRIRSHLPISKNRSPLSRCSGWRCGSGMVCSS